MRVIPSNTLSGNNGEVVPSPGNIKSIMFPSIANNSNGNNTRLRDDHRPLYAIDHSVISVGKLINQKRQIRFKFGFASLSTNTNNTNINEEHDIILHWSPMISGRVVIQCDGQEVHNSVMRSNSFTDRAKGKGNAVVDVTWSMRGGHSIRLVAHANNKKQQQQADNNHYHQYDLFVNGVSYFNFLALDQLICNKTMKRRSMPTRQPQHDGLLYNTTVKRMSMPGMPARQPQQDEFQPEKIQPVRVGGQQQNSRTLIDRSDRSRESDSSQPFGLDQSSRLSSYGQTTSSAKSMMSYSDRSGSARRAAVVGGSQRSLSKSDRSRGDSYPIVGNPNIPSFHPQSNRSRHSTVGEQQSQHSRHNQNSRSRRHTQDSVSTEQTEKVSNLSKAYKAKNQQQQRRPKFVQPIDDIDDYVEDDFDNNSVDTMKRALRTSFVSQARILSPPSGNVTIVYTDVQGSTSLWESCPGAMKRAQEIHDDIMRQCYADHKGYEITTEGDAFNLAFQHPSDAIAFALKAQIKLYKAEWPSEILMHPDGKEEPYLKFKGLRVRFGINHGPTTNQVHRVTGRTIYAGEGVKIAKAVEGLCHGGQILLTIETWKAVAGLAERYLGRPQILDCGEHVLFDSHRQRYSRRIMQLIPNELAFDFESARGQVEDGTVKDAALVKGRLFPPLRSKKQLTTSFLNAPYTNGSVVICFVYTVGLKDDEDSESHEANHMKLSKNLRKQLLRLDPPGYECQEDAGSWMLAFHKIEQAVMFGLKLMASIREGGAKEQLLGDVDCEKMYKIGIVSGSFTAMGPHKTTGMADYFGPIVNRAARVASDAEPGQVNVGIALANGTKIAPPTFGPTIDVRLVGIKQLKGVTVDVAIYRCTECASGCMMRHSTV